LAIDEELATLVLQSVLFLHEVLGKSLNLSLEQTCELVELGVDDHFYDLVLVDLVLGLEDMLWPRRFQIEQEEMRLQVAQILNDGVIDVFHVEFLELDVDSSLEQNLLLLVKMLKDLLRLANTIRKFLGRLRDGNHFRFFLFLVLVSLLSDEIGGLVGNDVEHILTALLNNLDFLDQLVDVEAVLFDSGSMGVHNLLANVALTV